jgi:hypothetical protein
VESSCGCGNEPSGSIKCCEFLVAQLVASRVVLSSIELVSQLQGTKSKDKQHFCEPVS